MGLWRLIHLALRHDSLVKGALMRTSIFIAGFLLRISFAVAAPIDWAQPPVGCIEELAPKSTAERAEKIEEIYNASEARGVPPQVLFGALMQEAGFENLGISADGGNFSCGIGQLNVREWCDWANTADAKTKAAMEWPAAGVACDESMLPAELVRPFYEIAKVRAPNLTGDQRGSIWYNDIPFGKVSGELAKIQPPVVTDGTAGAPPITITADVVRDRFAAASSFTRYCGDVRLNIRAKGFALKKLFDEAVPAPLQRLETYPAGQTFERKCMRPTGKVYPLHTGWLMSVAMYNAGKKFVPRIASYYRMTKASIETDAAWAGFTPLKLIKSLYGGGRYNPETAELNYLDLDGNPVEASWWKACIAHRHVYNVIAFSSLPGKKLASMHAKCSKTTPPARQISSGFFDL